MTTHNTMILNLVHVMILVIWLKHLEASAQAQNSTIAKPGCDAQCGYVDIPYPFGMNRSECYADKWFEIECKAKNTKKSSYHPYLKSIGVEVYSIDVSISTVEIRNPINRSNCGTKYSTAVKSIQLKGSPFVYSQDYNKFLAVGCNKIALLQLNGEDAGGCVSICNDKDDIGSIDLSRTECNGISCCKTFLPKHLSEFSAKITSLDESERVDECSYAMIVKEETRHYYTRSLSYCLDHQPYGDPANYIGDLKDVTHVPAVLEWEILNSTLKLPADRYTKCDPTNVTSSQHKHSGWKCSCINGFQSSSNPYIAGGCPGMATGRVGYGFYIRFRLHKSNSSPSLYPYPSAESVYSSDGTGTKYLLSSQAKSAIIGVSASLGSIILLIVLWRLYKVVRKKIVKKRKERFFKQNGGLLLEQRLSSGEVNVDKVKLFSLKDLTTATDHFNVSRVLGKGGQGTVYKGMLTDGKIIAVKKFKLQGNVEEFINEFVILSQINHRNVVKLLGSCLETEIPLLVYEFIPNGNLFEYLHEQNEDLSVTWDMRLRIAAEVAGALFYLHSVASQPIYHRDIKSTNILLDEKYRAKVADFGTSRMISIEATHLTTVVQGTFGYLDPEYFHTSQFTEKSDVYSFGVVLVELLSGQRPISSLRPQEAKSLASYFILCIEEDRLFDVIDERVIKEGKKEHIIAVANLASRCLELNGKKRPTMKDVTLELEGIRKLVSTSNTQEVHAELDLVRFEDYQSWDKYSTILNIGSTQDLDSGTPTLEDIHILTI